MPLSLSGKHSEDSFLMLKDDSFLMLSSENSVAKLSNRNFLLFGGLCKFMMSIFVVIL